MLSSFRIPIGWGALFRRTANEVISDNCLGLAAQLAYYFFLALFPALLFMVSLVGFLPFGDVMSTMMSTLGRVAPGEVLTILQDQLAKISASDSGGLLTLGAAGALWSTSAGVAAIIDALNQTYDIQEARPWWKVRLLAIAMTIALAIFMVVAFVLVVAGPALAVRVAGWFGLGAAFTWTWLIVQWPVVFILVALAVAIIYYYGPDADQEWTWITPGSALATLLWLVISLGFRFYITRFGSYNATYGAIGGVIVLMLWFYFSGLALLVGAELNAEIEHASPYGKEPGEKRPGERRRLGRLAERIWRARRQHTGTPAAEPMSAGTPPSTQETKIPAMALTATPAAVGELNCAIDVELPQRLTPAPTRSADAPLRPSDIVRSGLVVGEVALLTYLKLRPRFKKLRS